MDISRHKSMNNRLKVQRRVFKESHSGRYI